VHNGKIRRIGVGSEEKTQGPEIFRVCAKRVSNMKKKKEEERRDIVIADRTSSLARRSGR
jgi:hypothetical protein